MTEQIDFSPDQRITQGIKSEVEKIYFNGFALSIGTGDVIMVLERNQETVAVLNASYTVAKTLSIKLNGIIKKLEGATENTIMTTDHINNSMKEVK